MRERKRLRQFLSGSTWAVVGASDDQRKAGNLAFRELVGRGKRVLAVNPHVKEVEGTPCYPSLADLPEPVDRVLIIVPPSESELVAREVAAAGLDHIWFQEGTESNKALAFCKEQGLDAIWGYCIFTTR